MAAHTRNTTAPSQPVSTTPSTAQAKPSFWSWFSEYLNAVIVIAALGCQITFTVIVGDIADPATLGTSMSSSSDGTPPADRDVTFPKEKVRFLIALSWFFFMATLGLAVVAKILFAIGPGPHSSIIGRSSFSWIYGAIPLLFNALPTAAFLILALATSAYVPVVGWVGVAFISLFGIAVLVLWSVLDGEL
ncbi:hypothetical protein V8F33_009933 [Rhypophila sp. PSN 637]